MPAERVDLNKFRFNALAEKSKDISRTKDGSIEPSPPRAPTTSAPFPVDPVVRARYRSPCGKRPTAHQWKVWDFLMTVPRGKVTTYKGVAQAVGGSARSAGTALRSNPFSPQVPCHRVIASDLFIGGFYGEWAKSDSPRPKVDKKRALLAEEGVLFDSKGYLCKRNQLLG